MGAAAAPVAAVSSFASLGMGLMGSQSQAAATEAQGAGVNAADQYQAALADESAQFATLQAGLTDVTMRQQLTRTLANIDAIRAGGNVDPTSPTTTAIENFNRKVSDRSRMASVGTSLTQASYDTASADYLRQAGSYAQAVSNMGAQAQELGGWTKFLTGLGTAVTAMA